MFMLDIDLMKIEVYVEYSQEGMFYMVEQGDFIEKLNQEQMTLMSYYILEELVEDGYMGKEQAFDLVGDWISIQEILESIQENEEE